MKKCPFCAELIQDEAIVCRFCGRDLSGKSPEIASATVEWKRFVDRYRASIPSTQQELWNGLTEEQQRYAATNLGLSVPGGKIASSSQQAPGRPSGVKQPFFL